MPSNRLINAVVTVYPEEVYTDADGNPMTRPSTNGITVRATIRPQSQSGTSARRAEQMDGGFFTEEVYTLRLPYGLAPLGSRAQVEWQGKRWTVFGEPRFFNGSRHTRRYEYQIRRN